MAEKSRALDARKPGAVTVDLVIPVLNEAHVLENSVATVRAFLAEQQGWTTRVVVVDNGSTDGTDVVARRLAATFPDVRFLQLPLGDVRRVSVSELERAAA